MPRFTSCGYVVSVEDSVVYHPGDSFTLRDERVDVLLAPPARPANLAIHELVAQEFSPG